MAGKVTIGCRMPNGLQLDVPGLPSVTLAGKNHQWSEDFPFLDSAGYTEVDADFWAKWAEEHKTYPPLRDGLIFQAKNLTDAKAMAAELKDLTTEMDGMPQNADGVKPDDE